MDYARPRGCLTMDFSVGWSKLFVISLESWFEGYSHLIGLLDTVFETQLIRNCPS